MCSPSIEGWFTHFAVLNLYRSLLRITIILSITESATMQAVTVSPKFQVVIPLAIRQAMGLVPGQKLQVLHYDNRIELIPVQSARKLRGLLRGTPNDFEREPDRT
jgi:AbrB family looped-hinge helix DNA binding protein